MKEGSKLAMIKPMNMLSNPTSQLNTQTDALILLALLQVEGVGNRLLSRLLQVAGSPQALWNAPYSFWEEVCPPQKRDLILKKINQGLPKDRLSFFERLGIKVIAYTDPSYPKLLKETHDAPLILYVRGSLEALSRKTLAVVGTRGITEYGRQVTKKLIAEVAPAGVSIISGLASGVDTCAHWAALNHQLPTVAVFGCGLDIIFPRSNQRLSDEILANGGALVSEYPLGTRGTQFTFPQRNRIVAGLSYGVLVIEGNIKSGALITARLAVDEGRTVFAVPGNILSAGSQGPLHLIKSGAVPVSSGDEILRDLNWSVDETANSIGNIQQQSLILQALSVEDRQLLELIPYDPVSIETIQPQSGLSSAQLGERLTMMELDGVINLLSGARVCRK